MEDICFRYEDFDCRIRRHPVFLHLSGYVRIPKGHWAFGKNQLDELDVHGGVSWFESYLPDREACADPLVWWIGFSCSEKGDELPGLKQLMKKHGVEWKSDNEILRDEAFVRTELMGLVDQLQERGSWI